LNLCVFLSYQTNDKQVAGKLKDLLAEVGIRSFLAHEDIAVSEEWRLKILEEIAKADVFICVLSKDYIQSPWCVQESGIAAFRKDVTVIALSLDGTIPQGFISHIQSVRVNPGFTTINELIPGFLKHDFSIGIGLMIEQIGRSGSFRGAEANFKLILPHVSRMTDGQIKLLLERSAANTQVVHANLCAREYIPLLLKSHGHLLDEKTRSYLEKTCAGYA
jgi:TIR domain